ncbi:MAG TPA: Calx-beta domain-containing protein [Thermoanaerobaculia bacterium]|nr:Calx-beta domain-containing protein [Thermoanaerobaculia bacterium]
MRRTTTPASSLPVVLGTLLVLLASAPPGRAEEFHVQVVDFAFQPANLTIQVGDTVTWTNSGADPHNVRTRSGPETFRCANGCDGESGSGTPSSSAWSFARTFDNEGTVSYDCEVHPVLMVGQIVVEADDSDGDGDGGNDQAGSVAFRRATFQTTEGAGAFAIGVERAGGDDGGASVRVRSTGGTATPDVDYTPVDQTLAWADGEDGVKTFDVLVLDDDEVEDVETVTFALSEPGGGVTLGTPATATLEIADDDLDIPPCQPAANRLCLGAGGRFQVEVSWRDFENRTGVGNAVVIDREDSGLFYFFDEANIEVLVKVLDACIEPLGNKYWVLFAASTNVEYTLTVSDTEADVVRTYGNELGNLAQATIDVEAFDTCP